MIQPNQPPLTTTAAAGTPTVVRMGQPEPATPGVPTTKPDDRPFREYGEPDLTAYGLTAEQDIRTFALTCATRLYAGAAVAYHVDDPDGLAATVIDLAAVFEAYIRDGDAGTTTAEIPAAAQP